MSIRIEVVGTTTKEVVKRDTGEIFQIPETEAYAHGIGKYPVQLRFGVAKGKAPYAPGTYELAPDSYYTGRFGELCLRRQLVLRPIVSAARTGG